MDSSPSKPLVRWGTIIPLLGGMAIGAAKAAGSLPLFNLSYKQFKNNESDYHKYWPEVPNFTLDTLEKFPSHQFQNIDFVIACCPCNGLSTLNSTSRGPQNPANRWIFITADFVLGNLKPKVFWGENAPGLFLNLGKALVPELRQLGARYGYSFSMMKTNTLLHGLPQHRVRTFYFFWRSTTTPKMKYIKKSSPHLHEYLKLIPSFASLQDVPVTDGSISERFTPYKYVLEMENATHQEFVRKIAKDYPVTITQYLHRQGLIEKCIIWLQKNHPRSTWTKTGKTFISYLLHVRKKLGKNCGYWDMSPKIFPHYCTAVVSKNVKFAVHPTTNRFLNVREILHLMGMPGDFQLSNPRKHWNHVCQNVPVDTAKDWTEEVIKFCYGKYTKTSFTFLKQDNCAKKIVEYDMFPVSGSKNSGNWLCHNCGSLHTHYLNLGSCESHQMDQNEANSSAIIYGNPMISSSSSSMNQSTNHPVGSCTSC